MRVFRAVPARYRDQLEADIRSAIERIEKDIWARGELRRMPKGRRRMREREALKQLLVPRTFLNTGLRGDVRVLLQVLLAEVSAT